MDRTKRVTFGYGRRSDSPRTLKIETPAGCVTLTVGGLVNLRTGRERLRIDIEPNADRFAGEDAYWWVRGSQSRRGVAGWIERVPAQGRKRRKGA